MEESPRSVRCRALSRPGRRGVFAMASRFVLGLGCCTLLSAPPHPPRFAADAARLETHVRRLSETLRPRDFGHPAGLDRVADYVHSQARTTKGRVSEQRYEWNGHTWRNILIRFGPAQGERIIVGAHYDAFGDLPGADDNASGVAGLLELARMLGEDPPKVPVELVAYALEEPPVFRTEGMGSVQHARELRRRNVAVRAMLCLEMIGFFSDQEGSQQYPLAALGAVYPPKGEFIAVVGDLGSIPLVRRVKAAMQGATPLPVESLTAHRSVPGVDYSDHFPYWDAGYPAVMITDTADNRNFAYHTREDTADRLDYRRMAQVVQGVYAAVVALAWEGR